MGPLYRSSASIREEQWTQLPFAVRQEIARATRPLSQEIDLNHPAQQEGEGEDNNSVHSQAATGVHARVPQHALVHDYTGFFYGCHHYQQRLELLQSCPTTDPTIVQQTPNKIDLNVAVKEDETELMDLNTAVQEAQEMEDKLYNKRLESLCKGKAMEGRALAFPRTHEARRSDLLYTTSSVPK